MMESSTMLDRLAMRTRPEGTPVMEQNWENLLFLHWPIEPSVVRALVPEQLELDTFEGKAWISITPFALSGLRLFSMPPLPGMDAFDELNVRTYVHFKGMPGIYFLSLDASKLIPAFAARLFFMLPYHAAEIEFNNSGREFLFELKRASGKEARFMARWQVGQRLRAPDLESLAFFLVERYCFFTQKAGVVNITRVYHHPWILDEALEVKVQSSMLQAVGLPDPTERPLAHFSQHLNVAVWAPRVA
jgi:uncharacterized protein YqjF (DUF2071 family)